MDSNFKMEVTKMNVRQTIEKLTGKDYFDKSISHQEKYEALINALGYDECVKILNIPKDKLKKYYKKDKCLNNWRKYPLHYFDTVGKYMLLSLGHKLHITEMSVCDGCCLAKSVARMIINETPNQMENNN